MISRRRKKEVRNEIEGGNGNHCIPHITYIERN